MLARSHSRQSELARTGSAVWTQETLTSVSEEHVPVVNVDGERPLAVVRASGAKSNISLGSQHFGVGVAIGEGGRHSTELVEPPPAMRKMHCTLVLPEQTVEGCCWQVPSRSRICWWAQSAGSIAIWRALTSPWTPRSCHR